MKRQRSTTDNINEVPRKRIIINRSASVLVEQRKKQRTLDEATRILQSLFATQQDKPTFSIPNISEIPIKPRNKGKGVDSNSSINNTININVADNSEVQAYHMLYFYKIKKATDYKHRSERCNTKRGKISDYLEAYLYYVDAFYNQIQAYKNGYHYEEFLNPENFFKSIHNLVEGIDKKLTGSLKYLHAIIIKMHCDIKQERCTKKRENKELSRDEVKAIVKSLKNCEEKIEEAFTLFDEAKELLSNQNLEFTGNCLDDARIVARENVNNWRVKEGVNFVSL
ncbi:hypothetical protein Glove_213g214 [Diversispora epigaea]|uniref:Uncharacterized protein n=1 Tax=Diversispora epigaea TaxID=1348612 RepID=A0A397IML3_9GLOM|nr:hypothetical protein Glove_213g214 [Diversispora epigaea]